MSTFPRLYDPDACDEVPGREGFLADDELPRDTVEWDAASVTRYCETADQWTQPGNVVDLLDHPMDYASINDVRGMFLKIHIRLRAGARQVLGSAFLPMRTGETWSYCAEMRRRGLHDEGNEFVEMCMDEAAYLRDYAAAVKHACSNIQRHRETHCREGVC